MEDLRLTAEIGNVTIGGNRPLLVQSMCNVPTTDTDACVEQCIRIFAAGGGLARITTRNLEEAGNLKNILAGLRDRGYTQPVSADVHFNPAVAFEAALHADKVRINPGNFAGDDIESPFSEFLEICSKNNTAVRIGVNHGSLSERILEAYGDSPQGMVESALDYLRICRKAGFTNVVVSLKSSNVRIMVHANRLMDRRMREVGTVYPLHLGVTEAGDGEDGRIRSAAGIGTLLFEGLGDTIRVSLTEEPEMEVPVAEKLIRATDGKSDGLEGSQDDLQLTEYRRRKSRALGSIGGDQVPVVIAELEVADEPDLSSMTGTSDAGCFHTADFEFIPDHLLPEYFPSEKPGILNYEAWIPDQYPAQNYFPLFDLAGFAKRRKESSKLNFILVRPEEVDLVLRQLKIEDVPVVLLFMHKQGNNIREAFLRLADATEDPILIRADYNDKDMEMFQIRAAAELSWYFIDGFADGIWLDNSFMRRTIPRSTAFKILQACRARMTETEFIACPSCGRTLFNIQDRLSEVRKATSHLNHLKIAIMGCIVNGPGEMADADYGYVGSGRGRVNLYRRKVVVKKNIAEEAAVAELVNLIKENGDWKD